MAPADLTRWNRAGLSRFRYVDANAATHLEALRLELASRFPDWQALAKYEAPPGETVTERTARILGEYRADRGDWAWETTRAFARALHILSEHIDAFANEGYLGTATQWQSLRRLAAMIGYTPAPPSSAATPLVLFAKEAVTSATVARGFAVKHIPAGAPPMIFETLEDIEIAPILNTLRLKGWNRNRQALSAEEVFAAAPAPGAAPLWPILAGVKVSAGGLAILASETTGAAVAAAIASIGDGTALTLSAFGPASVPANLTFDTALLHVSPSEIRVPFLNGGDVLRLNPPHDLVAGDVIAWKVDGADPSTRFAKVIATDAAALRLQTAKAVPLPAIGAALYRAAPMTFAQFTANDAEWRLPTAATRPRSPDFRITFLKADGQIDAGLALTEANSEDVTISSGKPSYTRLKPGILTTTQIWFADPGSDKPAAFVRSPLPAKSLEFGGKPPALVSGDPVVVQSLSGSTVGYAANRIDRIETDAGGYRLALAAAFGDVGVTAIHAAFAATLRPRGYDVDPTPAGDLSISDLELDLPDSADWPPLLARGRRLVLDSASGAFAPFAARIASTEPADRTFRIDQAAPAGVVIRRGDLIIHANVVEAGHGETKPVRVLGSGNASATSQHFVIDVTDVSHVRDTSLPGGVRADVRIEIEREFYSQVATLSDSEPADPHYVCRLTETGALELEFGDGRRGRRLPSGSNNVLATIRRGSGLAGNLPAGALSDIVKKHPAVESFRQPIAAAGGDDRETLDQIRQSAPGRLKAMDRAISAADYRQLGERFQGVWHAAAFELPALGRGREAVRVVIVPAGGGALGALADDIHAYLLANGLPSVDVIIEPFVAIAVEAFVRARVNSSRYDPREVEGRVRAALLAAFDLRLRRPGQPVYRSEVTRIVENTEGVSNSDVTLFASLTSPGANQMPRAAPNWDHVARGDDGGIWAVYPKDNQVIYAATPSRITVTTAAATF